jgi:hypothetical protein
VDDSSKHLKGIQAIFLDMLLSNVPCRHLLEVLANTTTECISRNMDDRPTRNAVHAHEGEGGTFISTMPGWALATGTNLWSRLRGSKGTEKVGGVRTTNQRNDDKNLIITIT